MAIAKKPKRHQTAIISQREQAAEDFIAGAAQGNAATPAETRKVPIMMRFDREVLARVEVTAKRRGMSRSAWRQWR